MRHREIKAKGLTWFHFRRTKEVDLAFLEEKFKFHPLDYDDIRTDTPISKMDPYKHYVFFVFHIPQLNKQNGRVEGQELYAFLSKDHLVTLSDEPIEAIEKFVLRASRSVNMRNTLFSRGSGFLFYQLLHETFRAAMPVLTHFVHEVAALEDELQETRNRHTTVKLGRARRNVLYLRHLVEPQRNILRNLMQIERPFLKEELHKYFDDVHDMLDTMYITADNLKIIIDGLFDVNEALLSHKTNDVITILTILSASLMLPTLIAGFYGMNVPWLPFHNNPQFVVFLYAVSFTLVFLGSIILVRRRRD